MGRPPASRGQQPQVAADEAAIALDPPAPECAYLTRRMRQW
jgi:hypothetical protein